MLLEIVVGVFLGNLVTAAFLAAFSKALRQSSKEVSGLTLVGLIFPLVFAALVIIGSEGLPPQIAALVPQ